MRVLELLDEINEIIDTSSGVPLTGKILIDKEEIFDILKEIRLVLPEEITQAQWIKEERQRILEEAKKEYEMIISDANKQAESLVEEHTITVQAKNAAAELTSLTATNIQNMKMNTYDYLDGLLLEFQEKMGILNNTYFGDMFTNLQNTFEKIDETVVKNRTEIKDLAYKTQMEEDV